MSLIASLNVGWAEEKFAHKGDPRPRCRSWLAGRVRISYAYGMSRMMVMRCCSSLSSQIPLAELNLSLAPGDYVKVKVLDANAATLKVCIDKFLLLIFHDTFVPRSSL